MQIAKTSFLRNTTQAVAHFTNEASMAQQVEYAVVRAKCPRAVSIKACVGPYSIFHGRTVANAKHGHDKLPKELETIVPASIDPPKKP